MNYYFLVASLPGLKLETPAPISFESLLATCSEHLIREDMEALSSIDQPDNESSGHPFLKSFNEKEALLRNALAKIRAQRLNRDSTQFVHETDTFDSYVEKTAAYAYSRGTPMDREKIIDNLRWNTADELVCSDPFSGSAILAYAIKLKINERWAKLDEEQGRQVAFDIVNKKPENNESDAQC